VAGAVPVAPRVPDVRIRSLFRYKRLGAVANAVGAHFSQFAMIEAFENWHVF
jgi:hypothetical protein